MTTAASSPRACPVCGAAGDCAPVESWRDPLAGQDYGLWRCPACAVVFAQPFRHPGATWYARFSAASSYEGLGDWRFDWFLGQGFRPGGKVLDAGCGGGRFLELARAAGYEAGGTDPNPEAVKAARQRGLSVALGDLRDLPASAAGSYDAVTLFDVLEHSDDPGGLLGLVRELLKPGGAVAITTPNDLRPTPFGRDAFDYPPHHLTRWTPRALEAFVEARGFRVVSRYHTRLPSWEYSRFLVARAQEGALGLAKRLLYGAAAGGKTFTALAEEAPEAPAGLRARLAARLRDRALRARLVRAFSGGLGLALAPLFMPVKLYYRLTRPGVGVTNCLLAVRQDAGPP